MFNTRMSWRTLSILFCIMLMFMWTIFSVINHQSVYHSKWYESPAPCVTPNDVINEMANLTFLVSDILKSFNIPHVLCYGTLYGALRIGRILPWDNNVNLCAMKKDLDKAPWSLMIASMSSHNIKVSHDHGHGELIISRNSTVCLVTLFIENNSKKIVREGWEYRYFSFMLEPIEEIPPHLMKAPFPTITFHGRPGMPVPPGDVELLKYLYKEDWWYVKPPLGCKGLS